MFLRTSSRTGAALSCSDFCSRRNGEPVLEVPNPVIDIEKCYEGIEHEVIKYLVKNAVRDENGVLLFGEDHLARVYEGTDGFRMLQSSRRFWVPTESNSCACAGCGSTKVTRKIEAAHPADDTAPSWSTMDLPPEHGGGTHEAEQCGRDPSLRRC
jgi:hypothetical protein